MIQLTTIDLSILDQLPKKDADTFVASISPELQEALEWWNSLSVHERMRVAGTDNLWQFATSLPSIQQAYEFQKQG